MASHFVSNWQTQVRKGVLELAVLNALRDGRMYGYEIAKRLKALPGLIVVEGTIYPLMSRLRKEGLVTTSLEPSPEGPARKYYLLSADGEAALSRLNVGWDQIVNAIDDLRSPPDSSDERVRSISIRPPARSGEV